MSTTVAGAPRALRRRQLKALGDQHRVDDMDNAVAGLDVRGDNRGGIDFNTGAQIDFDGFTRLITNLNYNI